MSEKRNCWQWEATNTYRLTLIETYEKIRWLLLNRWRDLDKTWRRNAVRVGICFAHAHSDCCWCSVLRWKCRNTAFLSQLSTIFHVKLFNSWVRTWEFFSCFITISLLTTAWSESKRTGILKSGILTMQEFGYQLQIVMSKWRSHVGDAWCVLARNLRPYTECWKGPTEFTTFSSNPLLPLQLKQARAC